MGVQKEISNYEVGEELAVRIFVCWNLCIGEPNYSMTISSCTQSSIQNDKNVPSKL